MYSMGWPSGPPPPSHLAIIPSTKMGAIDAALSAGDGVPAG